MTRLATIAAAAMLGSALSSSQAGAQQIGQGAYAIVEVTNAFGATKEIVLGDGVETGVAALDRGACERAVLAVRPAPGVVVCIPVWDLTDAEQTASGSVRVTLKSGATIEGKSFGTIVDRNSKDRNSLVDLKRLRVVYMPDRYMSYVTNGFDADDMRPSPQSWSMKTKTGAFEVRNVQVFFRYYSTEGYVLGGIDRTKRSATIAVRRGQSEIEAPIGDFSEIAIRESAGGGPVQVAVSVPGGTTTEGSLSLRHQDSKGTHDGREWWLVGVLKGTSLTRVAVSEGAILLQRE